MKWSEVAMIDEAGENGIKYMQYLKDRIKDLDANTSEIINQYIG